MEARTEGTLHGKRALVTGGTRGIGRAISLALAEAGAGVTACYRHDQESAVALERELKQTGNADHGTVRADLGSAEEVGRVIESCRQRHPALDALVHNAGAISHVPFDQLETAEWHRVLDTNLTAAYLLVQQALPMLGPGASVVLVGSKVAQVGVPLRAHYTAAKAGLTGLARSLCKELGPRGIRINVVAPGVTESPAADQLSPEQRARYESMAALRRLGTPEDVAAAVTFLAGGSAAYITGETLHVDGGM
ncbi:SDR family NAD(P)-dependent oxidoreductase [Streptomyces dysideae]|uniref:Short-chain dehydrogenase n=1 Tax=Streptomyces dysideae TaxID=909626 RepID=A0A117RXY3_9ACTN|nr:SDR family NAD(P)-dependent oxidoreductase [Streptomyces dysideae]KUO15287.1 short-chain dehydrogenase [Streptomyces dysideae]